MSEDKTGKNSSTEELESISRKQELAALQAEDNEQEDENNKVPGDAEYKPDNPRFTVTEESTWETDGGDGEDLYARSSVVDTETNIEFEALERNAFDVGYQVFLWDTVDDVEVDDWVNVTGYVVSIDTPDVDSIHQKFRLKLNMDAFLFKNSDENEPQYIDVTVWSSTNIACEVEKGDEIILTSVVVDEFNDDNYLSCNSASELHIVNQDYTEKQSERIRNYLKHYGSLDTTVRT